MSNIDDRTFREWVGHGLAGMEKAAKIREADAARRAAVDDIIPGLVEALRDNRRIRDNEVEKCAELLRDPVTALRLMEKLASHKNTVSDEAPRMGKLTTKSASASSESADDFFFRSLNLPN